MDRRTFIGTAAAGGAGLAIASACAPTDSGPAPGPDSASASQSAEVPPFEFDEATVDDLQRMMESGEHTARSIAQAYIERIEAMDRQGPELRSMIEINPTRSISPTSWTPSAGPAVRAGRCTAFRSR